MKFAQHLLDAHPGAHPNAALASRPPSPFAPPAIVPNVTLTDAPTAGLTLLVAGDLHLGRSSSRAPGSLNDPSARTIGAWERIIDEAIARRVHALVLTGDLVDRANRHWEAIGPIIRGVERLRSAGIRTVAVAGNHDFDVLPNVARQIGDPSAFHLLGGGGRWERVLLQSASEHVQLDGWSFPTEAVERDPLETYSLAPTPGVATLGVVHGDLDAPRSRYAPLRSAVLAGMPVDGWLLGHVHSPSLRALGSRFSLYPGSPQAMDFGEPGSHGAWLVIVAGGRVRPPEFVPLSTVRYETLAIALDGIDDVAAIQRRVLEALRELEARCVAEGSPACAGLSVRVRLHGRTAAERELAPLASELGAYDGSDSLRVRVDDVVVDVLPPIDLDQLAGPESDGDSRGGSPLAIAARLLRALERAPNGAEGRALVAAAQERMRRVADLAEYGGVRDVSATGEQLALRLLQESLRSLVSQMLAQESAR